MSIEVIEPSVVDVGVPHLVMVDHDAVVVIDGDEALVEGPIMEGVEQQPCSSPNTRPPERSDRQPYFNGSTNPISAIHYCRTTTAHAA